MLGRPEAVAASVPPQWRDRLRERLLRVIYSFGWRVAARDERAVLFVRARR